MDSTVGHAHKGWPVSRKAPVWCRSMLVVALVGGLGVGVASLSRAGELPTPGCLDGGEPHRVAALDGNLELILDDGRHLRLAGVELPRDGDWPDRVRRMLTTWLTGRTVLVRTLAAEPDRWNRMPALVFAATGQGGESGRVSVTDAMIEAGLARVAPDTATASCLAEAIALEDQARAARRGLWGDPDYAVIAADDSERLAASVGRKVVVEGRILDVVEGRNRTYLRLTAAGRRGLAIALDHRLSAQIEAERNMAAWRGRPVRVRGFVEDRFGLQIELTSADQIEFTGSP